MILLRESRALDEDEAVAVLPAMAVLLLLVAATDILAHQLGYGTQP